MMRGKQHWPSSCQVKRLPLPLLGCRQPPGDGTEAFRWGMGTEQQMCCVLGSWVRLDLMVGQRGGVLMCGAGWEQRTFSLVLTPSLRRIQALHPTSPLSCAPCTRSAEAFARNAAWAEDEGIVPPGMGAHAQLVQGLLGGAAVAALAAGGWGNEDDWGDEEGDDYDEQDDRFEEAGGLGEEDEEESEEEESEEEEEDDEGSEDASSGGE